MSYITSTLHDYYQRHSQKKKIGKGFGTWGLPLILGVFYAFLRFITGTDSYKGMNPKYLSLNMPMMNIMLTVGTGIVIVLALVGGDSGGGFGGGGDEDNCWCL